MRQKSMLLWVVYAATVIAAGTVGIINQSFAASNPEQAEQAQSIESPNPSKPMVPSDSSAILPQSEIQGAPLADQSANDRVDLSAITEPVGIPLNLADTANADPSSDAASGSTSEPRIAKLESLQANQNSDGQQILAIYLLSDGKHEAVLSQSDNIFGNIDDAVKDTQSWYDPSYVKIQPIDGHTAVIEDSPTRKQVHLITDSHFYTVGAPGTLDLDFLLDLAGTIKAE